MDFTVEIWDLQSGNAARKPIVPLKSHGDITTIAVTPDDSCIAIGYKDGYVIIWDIHCDREILDFRGHTACVQAVAFSPDGKSAVSSGNDLKLLIWDSRYGTVRCALSTMPLHFPSGSYFVFSTDSRFIGSLCSAGGLTVWDAQTGLMVQQPSVDCSAFERAWFSQDQLNVRYDGKFRSWKNTSRTQRILPDSTLSKDRKYFTTRGLSRGYWTVNLYSRDPPPAELLPWISFHRMSVPFTVIPGAEYDTEMFLSSAHSKS